MSSSRAPASRKRRSGDRGYQTTLNFARTDGGHSGSVPNAGSSDTKDSTNLTANSVSSRGSAKRQKQNMLDSVVDDSEAQIPGAYPLTGSPFGGRAKDIAPDAVTDSIYDANSKRSYPSSSSGKAASSSRPSLGDATSRSQHYRPAGSSTFSTSRSAPVKKLVIKGFKSKPRLPDNYEADTWEKLRNAVTAIHEARPVPDSLEELYRSCENLCHHKMATRLYSRLEAECENHAVAELTRLKSLSSENEAFLRAVANMWSSYCRQMIMIRSIFLFLDRTYVLHTAGLSSLWDMGLELFRKHIMGSSEVKRKTLGGLLDLVKKDRDEEMFDKQVLKSLIRMYLDLGIYMEDFEPQFLEETVNFYRSESERQLATTTSSEIFNYITHVEKRLAEEEERVVQYLDKSTRRPLIAAVERELLERHLQRIMEIGFEELMNNGRTQDMKRLYDLFGRVKGHDQLKLFCSIYVKRTGTALVVDPLKDDHMVQDLLVFKSKLDDVLRNAFYGSEAFSNMLKDAFECFVNVRQNKPAEQIAKFVDAQLRTGNKAASDEEMENLLDRVLILFRYIQGKDVFEAFYKRDLAKRLLLNRSASFDSEKSMISKLKAECGAGFTSKLEGMFRDMDTSRDLMRSFNESVRFRRSLGGSIELNVNVLTQGFWPTYPPSKVNLPSYMTAYQEAFKTFYLSNHNGRLLQWQNSLGHCVLKADFPKGKKDLLVSTYQAVVLLMFNDADALSFSKIVEVTGIEQEELQRILQSLACGKVRVLVKEPRGRDVNITDHFTFNDHFTHNLFRIKVNAIQMKETVAENAATTEGVFQDRRYQVEAAIVRIMKTRKLMTHTALLAELFKQLKFPAQASDLKKCIEALIDREYLERDKSDATKYKYLA